MRYPVLLVLLAGLAACDGQGPGDPNDTLRAPADSVPADTEGVDTPVAADTPAEVPGEARFPDAQVPACDPGTGCFLDPCEENGDCQAGWCVGHMGEDVCTLQCQTECPPGWSCEQVPGSAPDVVWVCISAHANLCLPCATGADCKGAAGADDVCVDYGAEGSFCGGVCQEDKDCPWGFSCGDVTTVAGVPTRQCVADAGVCPCTKKSVSLGLFTPCVVENAEGACPGKRVCTTEGLTPCDAMEPASEICDGQDNDCDGDTDEPLEIGGNYVNLCDDQNPCTTDSCGGAGGCSHQSLVQGECVDGDACTIGDHCEDGVCTGLPILCDDGDLCTDDSCDGLGGCQIAFNQAACDDGDPCTVGDGCQDGLCAGWPVDCACDDDADCAPLEDGNPCNGSLVCSKDKLPFSCIVDPDTVVLCPPIPGGDLCTEMVCDPGTGDCVADPAHEGYACDDGDSCTLGDLCQEGTCQGGPGLLCADGNPCTTDGCDPEEGCTFTPSSGACNDGNACTKGDFCSGGQCVAGPVPLSCSDQNSCTLDACDPFAGCTHVPAPGSCNDGNACTTGEACSGGVCLGGAAVTCTDGNLCTTDSCNPATGCVFQLNQAPCNDDDLCTIDDHCHLGSCIAGGALSCKDGNPCTDDACDPDAGCVFLPNSVPCDDGNDCTTGDHCAGGACAGGPALACNDGNPCTDDYCDVSSGCLHVPNSAPCNDLNACTANEFCHAAACGGGVPIVCVDGNPCTDDGCAPATGCTFVNNSKPCTDGDACTTGDACGGGSCVPGSSLVCDDDNDCTEDACVSLTGCVFTPVEDETPCGPEMHCIAGLCEAICQPAAGSQTFGVVLSVQSFTVPACVESVTIEAWGAQGGKNNPCSQQGGKGARIKGSFSVTPGETLKVVVGQKGKDRGSDTANQSGTGGGGSFVWRSSGSQLLLAAGGGGGGAICTSGGDPGFATGRDGVVGPCGTKETTNANSGGCSGADGTVSPCFGKGWNSVLLDPAGGGSGGDAGGYGGGGTVGASHGGGGGGGYGGGACKPYTGNPAAAGGGGGSFNGGSATEGQDGARSGDGQVTITW